MLKHFAVKLFQCLAPIQVPQHALLSMLAQQQVISTAKTSTLPQGKDCLLESETSLWKTLKGN